jgi:hypothetical protein
MEPIVTINNYPIGWEWHKHSTYIRLKLREILEVNLTDITIIDIISLP